ncbi:MAG: spermidine synthase [Anaerolineales bacterium]|nr:spermidine synthase [Anaerolineales bacterium]
MQKRQPIILFLFASLFLVSGAAGLVYQIVWERLLELFFGVTMVSVTLIVGAFMAGLGLGSLLGGRLARQVKNMLLVYGLLELGVAAFGLVSQPLIFWIGQKTAGSPYALVFLISFAILLIPTTLMGMTLPLLTQSFVHRVETSGSVIGILYGINTLGAAFGTALAGFVLIGTYGFDGTTTIAVAMNAIVGFLAVILARWKGKDSQPSVPEVQTRAPAIQWGYATILVSSFLVGFIGLGFEMLWIRILHIVNKNTAYSFPSILFIFLLGLALGGYIFGRAADRSKNPVLLFCKIEMAGAILATFTLLAFWWSLQYNPPWIQNFFETQKPALPFVKVQHELLFSKRLLLANLWDYFLPVLILVLPASLVQGGGLPVLDRIAINNPALAGRRVGDIHLANIIGSVAGTLAIGFVLLPGIGSEWTLKLLALLTVSFSVFYFLSNSHQKVEGEEGYRGRAQPVHDTPRPNLLKGYGKAGRERSRREMFQLAGFGLILLLGILLTPGKGQFYTRLYETGMNQEAVISESGDSVLALTYVPGSDRQEGLFWIGGEVNSFFPPKSVYENRALACAGASEPERVLVIGFGGGYTALFFKAIPGVEEIVVVELLGDIAPFLHENLVSARVTLDDPRVTYIVDDGRRYLNASPDEKFDLIAIDPLREHFAGHNNLYSEEALGLYLDHLSPGGVLCAWMKEDRIVPHTVARVFPYADLYLNELMIASDAPITYNPDYMDVIASDYRTFVDQLYVNGLPDYPTTEAALSGLIASQDDILEAEKNTPYLTDLKPWLEYYLLRKPIK